jgi:hypothetical protein
MYIVMFCYSNVIQIESIYIHDYFTLTHVAFAFRTIALLKIVK